MTQVLRFAGVGGIATLLHYGVAVGLVYLLALHPELANVGGFLVAFGVSFLGHWRWTFREQPSRFRFALPAFFVVAGGFFLLNASLFHLLLTRSELRFELALLLVQALIVVLTFLAGKYWAFAGRM
ncbi:GtrA family protein [Desulfurivibrio sp. C05AmB]|uniref:GtrA family protein n=1 Tax=Desulfurivibrio sp. C05AmB TaxID=3374371 RepID=UPI00376EFAD1